MQNSSIQTFLINRYTLYYLGAGGLLVFAVLLSLTQSSVHVETATIFHILLKNTFGINIAADIPKNIEMIIWEIRFPRVLLALLVGSSLALAGAAFQGLLRNPLADPYTIGVSSGAALGAVCVIFFQLQSFVLGSYTLPIFAIMGALFTLLLVFSLTKLSSRTLSIETLILAGIIISSFISACISLIVALSGEELRQIIYWLMGSVGMRGWRYVQLILPFFMMGSMMLLLQYRELNALALGEEAAHHVGVRVQHKKLILLIGASLLTGASVAVSGMIGFVGLVIPHLVRLVTGPNHRHVLPLSMMVGGTFLVFADMVARTMIAPKELPIGVITALIGAPVFAVLLIREKAFKSVNK